MQLSRKTIATIILLGLIYSWFFATHFLFQKRLSPVTVTNTNISLFVEPDDGKKPIIDAIDAASKEILIEVYLFSDPDIISSLKSAKQRGVNILVMMEEHPFGGNNLNGKTQHDLQSAGIMTEWTNPTFALTHEKTITIDGKESFILNQNLTTSAFSKNREYDIIDTNFADVSEVKDIFMADWKRSAFTPPSSSLIDSPDNSRISIASLINKSAKNIDIEIEDIDDSQITQLLIDKARTQNVRIIIPTLSQIASNSKAEKILSQNGVAIKTLSSPYIHAKLISIDDSYAYTGSVNLSTQSMDQNREVGIIFSDKNIINRLEQTFEKDWQNAKNAN